MRNMLDRDCPLSSFAASIDVLSCNRQEWETLEDREEVAWQVSILVVTDGPGGSTVRFTTPAGDRDPPHPGVPPRPSTRATPTGPAKRTRPRSSAPCSTTAGTPPGVVEEGLIRMAAERASAAAALELDRVDFGFPSAAEIDAALRAGRIEKKNPAHHRSG